MSAGPPENPAAQLAAWQGDGRWRLDPVRFHFLQALARRIPRQAPAVQVLLEARLAAGVAEFAARVGEVPPRAPGRRPAAPATCAALAELNALLKRRRAAEDAVAPGREELASVRRFRASWERERTLQRLQQAVARRPSNAGPLNSHALVVQLLELAGELSPDYLRHLVQQVETLQWLEQSLDVPAAASTKPRKAARTTRRSGAKGR